MQTLLQYCYFFKLGTVKFFISSDFIVCLIMHNFLS